MLGKNVGKADGRTVGIVDDGIAHQSFKILHGCHLRIGWLISLRLLSHAGKQGIPLLHKRMGLHHHHEADMVCNRLTVALDNMR